MPALISFLGFFVSEGSIAILVAVIGPAVTLVIARWTAKRQEHRDDNDDEFRFRGELSTDNHMLRAEVKDLKAELTANKEYILRLEQELRIVIEERHTREKADVRTGKRSDLHPPPK